MAALATILPVVADAARIAIPLAPSVISFIEQIFGDGGGDKKKQAAVDLLKAGLVTAANAGKIPSAGVVDPSLPAALADLVQKTFDSISVNGKIPAVQPAAASSPVTLAAKVVSGAGKNFLIIEV